MKVTAPRKFKKAYSMGGQQDPSDPNQLNAITSSGLAATSLVGSVADAFDHGNAHGRQSGLTTGLKQGASMAATGAKIGGMFGPEGALIGAGVGFVGGVASGLIGAAGAARKERAEDRYNGATAWQNSVSQGNARIASDPSLVYGNKDAQNFAFGGIMDGGKKPVKDTTASMSYGVLPPNNNPYWNSHPIQTEHSDGSIRLWGENIKDTKLSLPILPTHPSILPSDKAIGSSNLFYPSNSQMTGITPATIHSTSGYYEDGGDLTTKVPAKQFFANYMSSPLYKARLKNAGPMDAAPDVQALLNTNILNKNGYGSENYGDAVSTLIASSKDPNKGFGRLMIPGLKPNVGNINIDRQEISKVKKEFGHTDTLDDILAHELSHQSREITGREQLLIAGMNRSKPNQQNLSNFINSKSKDNFGDSLKSTQHDDNPYENKADLDALRYMMSKKGIYDTSKRDMTIDDFNKASQDPEIKSSLMFNRMIQRFKPTDIVTMNNTIASNNSNKATEQSFQAKNGGSIISRYNPHTNNGAFTDYTGSQIYKIGGKIKAFGGAIDPNTPEQTTSQVPGGSLTPMASNSVAVNGNSHAEGGVQLPSAEVEGGESIADGFVFSKTLGFADMHKPIAKAIGKIEDKPINPVRRRTLEILKGREQGLAISQELYKKNLGIPSDIE